MNETTKNFLEVFGQLEPWTPPQVLFRLYYDDQGRPIEYSHEDKSGNYIDVDPETFRAQPRNVRVINHALVKIEPVISINKLVPGEQGVCCHPEDVCVVVTVDQPHTKWSIKTNETN